MGVCLTDCGYVCLCSLKVVTLLASVCQCIHVYVAVQPHARECNRPADPLEDC